MSTCVAAVTGLFLYSMFLVGTFKAIGIVAHDMSMSLNFTATDIGIILGLLALFGWMPAPILAAIYKRGKVGRPLAMAGAFLISTGIVATSLASSSVQVAICLSAAGLGFCVVFVFLTLSLNELTDNFNLLFSLGLSGYGVGMVLPPLLAQVLLSTYGWRAALLLLGTLSANIVPCVMAVRSNARKQHDGHLEDGSTCRKVESDEMTDPNTPLHMRTVGSRDEVCQRGVELRSRGPAVREETAPLLQITEGHHAFPSNTNNNVTTTKKHSQVSEYLDNRSSVDSNDLERAEINKQWLSESLNTVHAEDDSDIVEGNIGEDIGKRHILRSTIDLDKPNPVKTTSDAMPIKHDTLFRKIADAFMLSPFATDPCGNFLYISCFAMGFVYNGWHSFLIPHALQRGISPYSTLVITFFAALGNFGGRVFSGLLTRSHVTPINLFLGMNPASVPSLVCYAYVSNRYLMVVMSFLSAVCIAGRANVMTLMGKERARPQDFSVIFAAVQVAFGTGNFTGGYLSGLVADYFGSFDATFKLLAVVDALVFLSIVPLKLC